MPGRAGGNFGTMITSKFRQQLSGKDLRSIGSSDLVAAQVNSQDDFDELFACLFVPDRLVVMRAADAVEKVTTAHPEYLNKHKEQVLKLCTAANHKELKWHLALLVSRLELEPGEYDAVWKMLFEWTAGKEESKIVRVNALQSLFELLMKNPALTPAFLQRMAEMETENIPSINARIRLIRKEL